MPLRLNFDPAYVPPSALEVFDRTIGRLMLDGEPVGYISFRLDRMATQIGGLLWWRRFSEPFDAVEWMEVFRPNSADELRQDWVAQADSELTDAVIAGVWITGAWKLGRGYPEAAGEETVTVALAIEFLQEDERDRAWTEFGWGES